MTKTYNSTYIVFFDFVHYLLQKNFFSRISSQQHLGERNSLYRSLGSLSTFAIYLYMPNLDFMEVH